jgi:hypothetical protein
LGVIEWLSGYTCAAGSQILQATGTGRSERTAAAMDNATARERECSLQIFFGFSVAPIERSTVEVYFIYTTNDADYEDGSDSVEPLCEMAAAFRVHAVTGTQCVVLEGIPLRPFKFKILIKNKTDQVLGGIGLSCFGYSEQQKQL